MERITRLPPAVLCLAVLCGWALAGSAGCSPGVRWRLEPFEPVFSDSRGAGKLTLVYFRSWYSVQCTRAEDSVFNAPAMRLATADMNCVMLDFDWDRPLATGWRISSVPAFVILDPQGTILASQSGEITLQGVLDAVAQAKSAGRPATQPASGP